jgi:hypothetical protein
MGRGGNVSLERFQALLQGAEYRKNDKKYFPLWVRRYAESVRVHRGDLPVTVDLVTEFSRSLRDSGTPAWQRLQAVRAVEAYRDLALGTREPSLTEMRHLLQRRAAQERDEGTGASPPGVRDERQLAGIIDPNEPPVVQQVRREAAVAGIRFGFRCSTERTASGRFGPPPLKRCKRFTPKPQASPANGAPL